MSNFKERLQIAATKKTGYYWAGKPCKATFFKALIVKSMEKEMYWGNAFSGQHRQVIEIQFPHKEPFYIDNEDGTGLHMIREMKGNLNAFRRGVMSPILLAVDKPNEPNNEKYHETEATILQWLKDNHHEYYLKSLKKMEAMKKKMPQVLGVSK